jgi:hypothetical protein
VLRELDQPLRNLNDLVGIDTARLEAIESRLKSDILSESEGQYGNVLVHDEIEIGEIRACWNSVHESNVKTGVEVYSQLKGEGYNVRYKRIPVTAESVFEAKQLDAVVRIFVEAQRASLPAALAQLPAHEGNASATASPVLAASEGGVETFFVINDQVRCTCCERTEGIDESHGCC